MHIIVLAVSISGQRGGIEKSTLDICKGLRQRGHRISLIYEQPGDQLKDYEAICDHIYRVKGYRIKKNNIISSIVNFLSIYRRLNHTPKTIVYSSQYHTFFFGATLSKFTNSPFVCHLRLPSPVHTKGKPTNRFSIWKENITLAKISRFIAISNSIKQDWSSSLNLPESKFDIVFNGIDVEKFKFSKNLDLEFFEFDFQGSEPVISYVGRLDKDKGLEVLIKAFSEISSCHPGALLVIAGKSVLHGVAYEEFLRQLAGELGIGERVIFLGYLNHPMLLYQVSDISVIPSIWPEPFGRTVIESLASGVPVAGSRIGGIPEILSGQFSKWLFEPGDEKDLARVLNSLINWRRDNPSLSEACRDHVIEKFTLEKTLDGVESSMKKALASYHHDH